ncbi:hypothetical protein BDV38DRAFT_281774 [Aspergillus pseudotamarii]|uniref:Uncharacterized protein n=1 Tax=Aspergillus pseudotamarii TaxID=132259 RepID=A0A5N6SW34_ASPPS|nr:uncharacterized protein BDV38DRAFT_281774 [Aspergillus pseudotamarii]KAE8138842.1 hypothetical protein BDV38DRAFT_281774 [Aspergillus pseudotamarii]
MGNSQSIADTFFPDNPNRRARAKELATQIRDWADEYNELKREKEAVFKKARVKLDKVLKDHGYNTPEELETKVRSQITDSVELRRYDALAAQINREDYASSVVFDIVGLLSVGSGVIIGAAFVLGIITGPVGLAAVEVVGALAAAATVLQVIWGALSGYMQREKLREAIKSLWVKRVEIKIFLERMRAIHDFGERILDLVNDNVPERRVVRELEHKVGSEYNIWTEAYTIQRLHEMDIRNKSWISEDPSSGNIQTFASIVPANRTGEKGEEGDILSTIALTPEDTGDYAEKTFSLKEVISDSFCLASCGEQLWRIEAKSLDPAHPTLENIRLTCERILPDRSANAEGYYNCKFQILHTSTS